MMRQVWATLAVAAPTVATWKRRSPAPRAAERRATMQAGGGVIHEDYHLQARTDSIKTITTMISTLLLKGSQVASRAAPMHMRARERMNRERRGTQGINGPIASCKVEEEGIRLTVSEAKSMQATAYLKRNLFHEWQFVGRAVSAAEPRALSFGLNLGTFVECLRILGGRDGGRGDALDKPATLRLEYRSSTAAFQLTLVEGAAVTECRLRTLETEDDETLVMDEEVAAKVVLKSDSLRVRRARAPRARPYRASAPVAAAPRRLTRARTAAGGHRGARVGRRQRVAPEQADDAARGAESTPALLHRELRRSRLRDGVSRRCPPPIRRGGGRRVRLPIRATLDGAALAARLGGDAAADRAERAARDPPQILMCDAAHPPAPRSRRAQSALARAPPAPGDGKSFFVDVRILPLVDEDSDDQFDHGGVNDDGD